MHTSSLCTPTRSFSTRPIPIQDFTRLVVPETSQHHDSVAQKKYSFRKLLQKSIQNTAKMHMYMIFGGI
eukprot:15333062-Ditylum_brightwellii.AAC.1